MDDFTLDDLTVDNYVINDCTYMEDLESTPESVPPNYINLTHIHTNTEDKHCKEHIQKEKNIEFDICRIWCHKPVTVLREYCDAIKVYVFWPLLFQRQNGCPFARLHPCVEANNSRAWELSLERLQYIELLEEIVELTKKVANSSFFIGSLLRIGYKIENKMTVTEEALNWVKFVGDITLLPKLGSLEKCWPMLSIFFTEYKYHITKFVTEEYNLLEEFKTSDCEECSERGDIMKIKGNEEFHNKRFDLAIIYYTRAIEYRPENHILYGNRALCFLRTGQFRNALGDGKRATVLKSTWPKGHYHFCDALSLLGEYEWALKANIRAQEVCRHDPAALKELIQQYIKFQRQIEDRQGHPRGGGQLRIAGKNSREYNPLLVPSFRASLVFVDTEKTSANIVYEMASGGRRHRRSNSFWAEEHNYFVRGAGAATAEFYDCQPSTSKPSRHQGRHSSRTDTLRDSLRIQEELRSALEKPFPKSARAAHQDFIALMKLLKGLIQDGYESLLDQRCRCVFKAFTHLINGLDNKKIKELTEAEKQFKRILRLYPNEGLDCLAYCGIGSVYLKKNRFSDALKHFEIARNIIGRLPRALPWPTNSMVIEETRPGRIKVLLEKLIEECKFPPPPEGICAYHGHCTGVKIQIYISDPDFKGYIRVLCSEICKLEFHTNCWKRLKALCYDDKQDKDFLNASCLTPDCHGVIYKITVYNSKGGMKCEFEHKVIKEKLPPRPILKQKCTSLVNLKEREEKKMNRKLQKEEAKQLAKQRMEEYLRESNLPPKEEKKEEIQAYQYLDDRILQCLLQYSQKIKAGVLNISVLMKELLSWKVLTPDDYTACFSSRNFLNDAVDFIIQLLIDKSNRVKTRKFLHVLSEHKEIDPQVASWIEKLNGFGYTAVGHFFSRYGEKLKNLNFTFVSILWNEKYASILGSIEGKTFEYFREPASLKEARCLIWLLEDHRDKFPALHSALDEFFDILDSSCTVLRKQDHNDDQYAPPAKVRSKGKKKKPKDMKPMLVGSGLPSLKTCFKSETVASRVNRKGNSGRRRLRKEVEEFEAYYHKKQQLQNPQTREYTDQSKTAETSSKSKSTLYDYFSEYLEDNGPLDIRDKVFSNEYRFFPEETRQIVQKAGGLKQFLLRCPRFVVIDNCIALRKVPTRFRRKGKKRIKEEVDDLVNIEDELYLPFFLSLSSEAKEVTPESDPSSSPAKEDPVTAPASADSACAGPAVEPKLASGDFPRPVSEDGYAKWIASDSPQSGSEVAVPMPASSQSLVPVFQNVSPAYWAQPPAASGYCTYLSYQGYDITQTPPVYINELSSVPPYAGVYTPLTSFSEYELQQGIPFLQPFVTFSEPNPNAAAGFEGPQVNAEKASGNQQAPVKSFCSSGVSTTALSESSRNGFREKFANQEGENRIETNGATAFLPTQKAAIQVPRVMVDQEVNTDPYEGYEAELGDISRMEKEYRKLQEMLEHAYENYEQTRFKGLADIKDLEEKLEKNAEQNQASQEELERYIQNLEKENRKWQQEKKEAQEKVKALRKKVKRLCDASEMCTQKNDEKDEEHGLHLDESLEIRNSLANEKAKLEARIKKGGQSYVAVRERFMDAEVSVLESWKELYLWKLEVIKSSGENYVEHLRSRSSDYDESLLEAVLQEWYSCFSWIKDELEIINSQVEEKVEEARSGADVCEITDMFCLPVFDQYKLLPKDAKNGSASAEHASADQSEVARLLACAKKAVQEAQSRQNTQAEQKSPSPQGRAARSSQKPFNSIIEHLAAVFPCYSSSRLAGFVKKVRVKSSLLGLSIDETVGRVIRHILIEQKKEPSPGREPKAPGPSSENQPSVTAPAPPGAQEQRQEEESVAPTTSSCEVCQQALEPKNTCVLNCKHTFHTWCFKQWLKGPRVCPGCFQQDE
ncbi:E3 ubiquitin-protein ligase TTC3 isoform X2 [Echinops telfairi]|nr:E3 ubiquitin-protein ligase TTC3 isoform X2 [Echinops telfairi]XP_045140398.1 E3 ubiquitin-protein ligase TTC3 isoform X2 [Echinops telfairi]